MKRLLLLSFLFIAFFPVYAQVFIEHKVVENESILSISKRYSIEAKELVSANHELLFGLKVGQVLRIPVKQQGKQNFQITVPNPEQFRTVLVPQELDFIIYQVKRRETLYSISRQFGITEADIIQYNPEARNGIKRRQLLKIPDKNDLALIRALPQKPVIKSDTLPQKIEYISNFFTYTVRSADTFWDLEKRYRMSQAEIVQFNPFVQPDGLQAGMQLQIPLEKVPKMSVFPANTYLFNNYMAVGGETVYSLSSKFGITVSEIKRFNPTLRYRPIISGDQILLPEICFGGGYVGEKRTFNTAVYNVDVIYHDYIDCQPGALAAGKLYRIGLLIPLYLFENNISREGLLRDSVYMSTITDPAGEGKVYPRSENFLHFLEGVLLAVDSLQRAGMRVQLNVFDTEQKIATVENIVNSGKLNGLDLIIGPFYAELQAAVSNFAFRNKIPIVSPLSSQGEFEKQNPYFFKVVPDRNLLLKKTSEFIVNEYFDKNIMVINVDEQNRNMIDYAKEELLFSGYSAREGQILFHENHGNVSGSLMLKDGENVFLIPSESEAQVSVSVTDLNMLSRNYPVTVVGSPNFTRFSSIQTEYLHNEKLTLVSPYFVDYKSYEVNNFIRKFRGEYENEPNQYSFQGYDVAFYFLSALFQYGNNFVNCLPTMNVSLTQLRPVFEKVSANGGYVNRGVTAIQYSPDFEIVRKGAFDFPLPY